jgi:predicted DCC family thiol-disulfide oxidoreductase YuxK
MENKQSHVIYFDGVCNLCNGFVDFVIRRDKKNWFRFASLQSAAGQKICEELKLPSGQLQTVVLYKNGQYLTKSKAAIYIIGSLGFPWSLFKIFNIVPTFISNAVYDIIARNRLNWFGKRDTCRLPNEHEKELFI